MLSFHPPDLRRRIRIGHDVLLRLPTVAAVRMLLRPRTKPAWSDERPVFRGMGIVKYR